MEPIKTPIQEVSNPQPVFSSADNVPWGVPKEAEAPKAQKINPLFPFMAAGSLIYAFFFTLFLYKNNSGITYPFFVGGTCLFFCFFLKKSGTAVKKFSVFIMASLLLLGISTCMTDSWVLHMFNIMAIFCLFFYLFLHTLYEDKSWGLGKYIGAIFNVVFSSLLYLFTPLTDFFAYNKERKERQNKPEGKTKYVVFGVLIALPLLFVIVLLLGSADAVFGNLVDELFSFELDFGEHFSGICFLFLFAFFASYCIMYRLSVHDIAEETPDKRVAEPLIAITFTGLLSVVYAVFCFIQIVYLFFGYGTLPENYTYAEYAREGFFQLVFVCIINLSLVLLCRKYFRESKVLKGILTFISLCTYIMIASSAYRMLLYIDVYYLTFLRVFVLWALVVIFLLMSGALITIYKEDFPLTKYCVITVTVFYLIFSFAKPDYFIARYNLSHALTATEIRERREEGTYYDVNCFRDFYYLENLSMDAAPAIFAMADELEYGRHVEGEYNNHRWFYYYADKIVSYSHEEGKQISHTETGDALITHLCKIQKVPFRKYNFARQKAYRLYTKYYNSHEDFADLISSFVYDI